MKWLEQLLSQLPDSDGVAVKQVCMGPFWTMVESVAGGIGLASTQLAPGPTHGEKAQWLPGAGHLTRLTVRELAENVCDEHPLARSVGLAALNALLPLPAERITEANAADLAEEAGRGRTIGVVGWFPFIPRLRQAAAHVEVFEKDPATGFAITPDRSKRLAACDVLCVTAGALLNETLDDILAAARPDTLKLLIGPGSPICGFTIDGGGFDAVCGAVVTQPDAVRRVVQEGGCFQQMRKTNGIRLVCLQNDRISA